MTDARSDPGGTGGDADAVPTTSSPDGSRGPRRPHRLGLGLAVGAAAAVLVVGLVWFQPHKLFVDDRVDDPVPTARPTSTTSPPDTEPAGAGDTASTTSTTVAAAEEPLDLATGSFVPLDHSAAGTVRVLELGDGRRFLRFEGFETENGPDLYVYLTANPAGGSESAFDDTYVSLGRLQGNVGDQNYELAPDVDLAAHPTVVVWCDRFDSAFAAADLTFA